MGLIAISIVIIFIVLNSGLLSIGEVAAIMAINFLTGQFNTYERSLTTRSGGTFINGGQYVIGGQHVVSDVATSQERSRTNLPTDRHTVKNVPPHNKVHRLLDMSSRLTYEEDLPDTPVVHWGQLKLFLSELEFLTKCTVEAVGRPITFVYAGAAPGDHQSILAELFPEITFELYDPNDFYCEDTAQITTHVQFFTNKDATYWKELTEESDMYLAFCSDIRSDPATDENIAKNMAQQLAWWKIMQPDLSMFKFRLPWNDGKSEYPEGDIYIQVYPKPHSSETRLIVRKNAPIIQYDNRAYEEACFYHNRVDRVAQYTSAYGIAFDKCYDCAAFEAICTEYLRNVQHTTHISRKILTDFMRKIETQVSRQSRTVRQRTESRTAPSPIRPRQIVSQATRENEEMQLRRENVET